MGPDGKPSKCALRCSIRIREVMGYRVGSVNSEQIIHLLVDDKELLPVNGQSRDLNASETWETDALFIIPANVSPVELIVGWSKDATTQRLKSRLKPLSYLGYIQTVYALRVKFAPFALRLCV